MATPTLLACPFCGETEIVICEFPAGHTTDTKAVVFSAGCKNEDCQGYMSYTQFDTRREAAEAWNRRTKRPDPTHYTLYQGGDWHEWFLNCNDAGDIFAVKFADGSVFDTQVGWRE